MPSSTSVTKSKWSTSALVVALLVSLVLLDRAVAAVLGVAYERSSVSPAAAIRKSAASTVVVGTSSARYAIIPNTWPGKLINLAQDGQTVLYSIAAARIAADQPGVQRIIVGIDPFDLSIGLENPSAHRIWRIAPSVAAIAEIAPLLSATKPSGLAFLDFASWPYRGRLNDILKGLRESRSEDYVALPPGPVHGPPPDPDGLVMPFSPTLDPYVDVLAGVARRPGLQLVLVVTPAYRDHRANRPAQRALLDAFRLRLSDAPVCDLTQVDTPALAAMRTNAAHFHDGIHLTAEGAIAYTREVARLVAERCASA